MNATTKTGQPYTADDAKRRAAKLAWNIKFYVEAGLHESECLARDVAAYDRLVARQGSDPLAS